MELYENFDLTKIKFLNQLTFEQYKPYCNTSCKNEAERKIKYNMLKSFCEAFIKCKGQIRRIYSYTLKTPNEVGGRLYCGNSVQGLGRRIRGFLCKDWTDIDMKNAHPVIARYLCKKNNIETPMLNYYIENRDVICARLGKDGKTMFLCALNDDKINKKVKDKFFNDFDKECKMIQSKINSIPEYKHIVDTTPLDKSYNWNGSAFNRIMCVYENKILQEVITVLNSKDLKIGALMFDGIMIYPLKNEDGSLVDYYKDENLLNDIYRHIENKFEGLNMNFAYKEHNDEIVIPENYETKILEEREKDDGYDIIKKQFEKSHAKIVEKAVFIKEKSNDEIVVMTRTKIRDAYEHMKYTDYSGDQPKSKQFISTWLLDDNIRQYTDFGVYPPPLKVLNGIYNMWRPFAISKHVDEYEKDEEGLKLFINHIKILCGNEDTVKDYIIKWFAQMFQYPAIKTIAPTFISEEGAGKGSLIDELISPMMGNCKILPTTTPSRDVWGPFNSLMASSFLVNLNEMNKKEAQDAEGQIKGLITDPRLNINKKNQDPYEIKSYHRFLITTNKKDPINTKKGDRRNLIIESSSEKADKTPENIKYFEDLRESFRSIRTQRTIYDYLMNIPDMDKFHTIPMPQTDYQNDMKEQNRDLHDRFVEHLTIENQKEKEIKLYGEDQYQLFKSWLHKNGFNYETSSVKMSLGIKRLKLNGIQSSIKDRQGYKTIYNIDELKIHYKIGCLISIEK
jgi:hypothetical protein